MKTKWKSKSEVSVYGVARVKLGNREAAVHFIPTLKSWPISPWFVEFVALQLLWQQVIEGGANWDTWTGPLERALFEMGYFFVLIAFCG